MAKKKRKWYKKKTNWAIILGIASQAMIMIPITAPFAPWVLKISIALGTYGIADRAGKENEAID